MLCPIRKAAEGGPAGPSEPELSSIRFDANKLKAIRSRLSDISWWKRLLCQRIAQKAIHEYETSGKFWQNRYRAVRLIDEEAIKTVTRDGLKETIKIVLPEARRK